MTIHDSPEAPYLADARNATRESLTPAILAGLGAALIGGIAWTVVVALSGYELGFGAWALGGLVGFGMSRTTARRDTAAAGSAAVLSLVGLLMARVLLGEFVLEDSTTAAIMESEEVMTQAAVFDLQINETLPSELQVRYDAVPENDTISDALWAEMVAAAEVHLDTLSEEQRVTIAKQFSGLLFADLGFTDRILGQMGAFDLLWALLAVSTAWGMMKREDEEAGVPPEA